MAREAGDDGPRSHHEAGARLRHPPGTHPDRHVRAGHRIVIDQLAAEFGVSTLPVREAVRRVQAEGLVVVRRNAGACVAPADPELVDSLIDLLAVVEGYATALAAPHLGRAGVARLLALTNEIDDAIDLATALPSRGSTASSTRSS